MRGQNDKNWFKKHKIITGILLFIVVIFIVTVASGGSQNQTNDNADNGTNKPAAVSQPVAETAKVGQAVRDGKFEFVVNSTKCGETSIGDQYLNTKAQGQFCRVNVSVKNIGNEAQTLSHSDQVAYNQQGQKYSADSTAAIYSDNSASSWYNNINPGNNVTGDLFFDVPKDVTLTSVELHDSAFSGGVKVNL